ncbi:MAG: 5-carboxymethyl-2-hydroxymuconate semialdehyde dehydrogenase [Candidatus Dormibacteraceae bacterium]
MSTSPAAAQASARSRVHPVEHLIGGRFVPAAEGGIFETIDPTTNEPITTVADGTAADVDRAVRAARQAFDQGSWPNLAAGPRARILRRIAELIEAADQEIAEIETLDTGLPITQAKGQAQRAAQNFRFFASQIEVMAGESFATPQFLNYAIRKPAGVAGLITPWNTPFMLESWKVAPCLAAGDTFVLKPAEWSPLSADVMAHIFGEAGLPEGVANVVHGFGETAGAPLVAHPGVQLISFTGETTTGSAIIANGAPTLKRYSMELGGKSPVLVFADADLDRALDAAVFGVFSLNGERCTAGTRLLVERSVYGEFVERVAERARKVRVGDPFDPRTELGPLIHEEHLSRVSRYLEIGRGEGRLLAGGGRPDGLDRGNYVAATVFADVEPGARVFQEEIFGPVVVATPFEGEEEALRLANDVRYGLAAYVWTSNLQRGQRVAQGIESGLVWLNSQNVRDLRTPFGGSKSSCIGREGGEHSFEFYCEQQTVHVALGDVRVPRFGAGD